MNITEKKGLFIMVITDEDCTNIYQYLLTYIDAKGFAPTMGEIHNALGISVTRIYKAFGLLQAAGYIHREPKKSRAISLPLYALAKLEEGDGRHEEALKRLREEVGITMPEEVMVVLESGKMTKRQVANALLKTYTV